MTTYSALAWWVNYISLTRCRNDGCSGFLNFSDHISAKTFNCGFQFGFVHFTLQYKRQTFQRETLGTGTVGRTGKNHHNTGCHQWSTWPDPHPPNFHLKIVLFCANLKSEDGRKTCVVWPSASVFIQTIIWIHIKFLPLTAILGTSILRRLTWCGSDVGNDPVFSCLVFV